MEAWETGVAMALVMIIYALIDRVVAPLIAKRVSNGKQQTGQQQVFSDQRFLGIEERLRKIEDDVRKAGTDFQEARTDIAVIQEIVSRIEDGLK